MGPFLFRHLFRHSETVLRTLSGTRGALKGSLAEEEKPVKSTSFGY
jgi:hypothetical protein